MNRPVLALFGTMFGGAHTRTTRDRLKLGESRGNGWSIPLPAGTALKRGDNEKLPDRKRAGKGVVSGQ